MTKKDEFSLTLKGFKTKEQVQAFIDWYEGQGEQDSTIWFEEAKHQGKIDVDWMGVDLSKKYKWDGNNLIAHVEVS
jgi:hypothetical protein